MKGIHVSRRPSSGWCPYRGFFAVDFCIFLPFQPSHLSKRMWLMKLENGLRWNWAMHGPRWPKRELRPGKRKLAVGTNVCTVYGNEGSIRFYAAGDWRHSTFHNHLGSFPAVRHSVSEAAACSFLTLVKTTPLHSYFWFDLYHKAWCRRWEEDITPSICWSLHNYF